MYFCKGGTGAERGDRSSLARTDDLFFMAGEFVSPLPTGWLKAFRPAQKNDPQIPQLCSQGKTGGFLLLLCENLQNLGINSPHFASSESRLIQAHRIEVFQEVNDLPSRPSPLAPRPFPLFPPGKGPVGCLTRSRQDAKVYQEADRPSSPILSLAPFPSSLTPLPFPLFPPRKGPVVCLTRSRQDAKVFQETDRPSSSPPLTYGAG